MTDAVAVGPDRTVNVLIVGVGGQGVIMVSKVLAGLCQAHGYEVKQSEVHGMAKRGGAVFSHVRYGHRVWSPQIPMGEADVLVALEWAEAQRWLNYLRPRGAILIADTKRIVPPFACLNRGAGAPLAYSPQTPEAVVAHVGEGYAIDATGIATELGNERTANTVLLGALSTALEFPAADWESAIAKAVPAASVAVNLAAFGRGREVIDEARRGLAPASAPVPVPAAPAFEPFRLAIDARWCKSCDICVKLCPERCLRLNGERIAELADAARCTGCRLCEWLCPDFAIRVERTA